MTNKWIIVFSLALAVMAVLIALGSIGGVDSADIANESIIEEDLAAIDIPADGECNTYDAASQGFEWETCGAGGGGVHPVNLASDVTGTLPITSGGTGIATLSDDQIFLGDGADSLAAITLPDCNNANVNRLQYDDATNIASCDTDKIDLTITGDVTGILASSNGGTDLSGILNGQILMGTITGDIVAANIPDCVSQNYYRLQYTLSGTTWSCDTDQINVSADITGIVPVSNGGTGTTAITSNEVMIGLGTAAITTVETSTIGFVLTSNGSDIPTWQAGGSGLDGPFQFQGGETDRVHIAGCLAYCVTPGAGLAIVADELYAVPLYIGTTDLYDQFIFGVRIAGGAGEDVRVGIYDNITTFDSGLDHGPNNLVVDCGTQVVDSTGTKTVTCASTSLTAGNLYWLALVSEAATVQPERMVMSETYFAIFGGPLASNMSRAAWGWSDGHTCGAGCGNSLPDPFPTTSPTRVHTAGLGHPLWFGISPS